jgi:hypothetical protein
VHGPMEDLDNEFLAQHVALVRVTSPGQQAEEARRLIAATHQERLLNAPRPRGSDALTTGN